MIDEDLRDNIINKAETDSLTADDLPEFMTLFCQIANENYEIQAEVDEDEFRNCVFSFEIDGAPDLTLKIEEKEFTYEEGAAEDWDAQLIIATHDLIQLLTGQTGGQNLYMEKRLEAHGGLPRMVKFQTILEIVLEELELI